MSANCTSRVWISELRGTLLAAPLADVVQLCRGRNKAKNLRSHQFVMQHDIGCFQEPKRFQSQQFRIARPCTYEIDFAFHQLLSCPFAPSK